MSKFDTISITRVVANEENNSRAVLGDLQDLTESIKAVGVLEPILVRDMENDREEVEVFAGYKRLAASKLAQVEKIPVIIYSAEEVDKTGAAVLNLAENVQREDLNPMDEAKTLRRLIFVHEMSEEDVCNRVGIKRSRLDQRLRLLDLPDIIQNALSDGKLSMTAAIEIAKLPEKKHAKYIKLAAELKGERLKRMVEKELAKIAAKAEKDTSGLEENDPKKEESAAYTELSRANRKHTEILANYLKMDEKEVDEVKSIHWRSMDLEDLQVVAKLFDSLADSLPNQYELDVASELEISETVDQYPLDTTSSIVREAIIQAVKNRAQELKLTGADNSVEIALDEFFGIGVTENE